MEPKPKLYDPIEILEDNLSKKAKEKTIENTRKELTGKPEEQDAYQKEVEKIAAQLQPPQPQLMRIQKGMKIQFYGYSYKCTAARLNGKVTLRFNGLWKGEDPK